MAAASIQDRTSEFKSVLALAQRKQNANKMGAQRRSLLTDSQKAAANGDAQPRRSDFARKAAEIGRGISSTMAKLEKLAQLAKRRTLFDDRPVEINELTFVIKQDLSSLNQQIGALQMMSKQQHPKADQEGEHNKNVVYLLQGKLTDVSVNFKDVLEARTKNIQASRSRTENFISNVSQHAQPSLQQSASPLYGTPNRASPAPAADTLSLNPVSDNQMLMMEEAQPANTYIQQRGEAIEAIEKTIGELGSIFGQLATMVSEQSEMIQRIDANTEDVVDNVDGAQRELLKYWSRVSGNRWLIAKMFGVLMIFFLLWVLLMRMADTEIKQRLLGFRLEDSDWQGQLRFLTAAIEYILQSPSEFKSLGPQMFTKVQRTITYVLTIQPRKPKMLRKIIKRRLTLHLNDILAEAPGKAEDEGRALLRFYADAWTKFSYAETQLSLRFYKFSSGFMDRQAHKVALRSVHDICVWKWLEIVLQRRGIAISESCVGMVYRKMKGSEKEDVELVKIVGQSLMEMKFLVVTQAALRGHIYRSMLAFPVRQMFALHNENYEKIPLDKTAHDCLAIMTVRFARVRALASSFLVEEMVAEMLSDCADRSLSREQAVSLARYHAVMAAEEDWERVRKAFEVVRHVKLSIKATHDAVMKNSLQTFRDIRDERHMSIMERINKMEKTSNDFMRQMDAYHDGCCAMKAAFRRGFEMEAGSMAT